MGNSCSLMRATARRRRMEALNLPVDQLTAVFITHFHADHFADLGEVIDRR
jgi:ribonuclease BN (tRNA processing enzyme)